MSLAVVIGTFSYRLRSGPPTANVCASSYQRDRAGRRHACAREAFGHQARLVTSLLLPSDWFDPALAQRTQEKIPVGSTSTGSAGPTWNMLLNALLSSVYGKLLDRGDRKPRPSRRSLRSERAIHPRLLSRSWGGDSEIGGKSLELPSAAPKFYDDKKRIELTAQCCCDESPRGARDGKACHSPPPEAGGLRGLASGHRGLHGEVLPGLQSASQTHNWPDDSGRARVAPRLRAVSLASSSCGRAPCEEPPPASSRRRSPRNA
jgi:hypothetical protein